jgi:hypothetical protein
MGFMKNKSADLDVAPVRCYICAKGGFIVTILWAEMNAWNDLMYVLPFGQSHVCSLAVPTTIQQVHICEPEMECFCAAAQQNWMQQACSLSSACPTSEHKLARCKSVQGYRTARSS